MAKFLKFHCGKAHREYINLDHVVSITHNPDGDDVHVMSNGEKFIGPAEEMSDDCIDALYAEHTIVPAAEGYRLLDVRKDGDSKKAYVYREPIIAWRVNAAAPTNPMPIVASDWEERDLSAPDIEHPQGYVTNAGNGSHKNFDEWLEAVKNLKGAEGLTFVDAYTGAVLVKTPAATNYRASAPTKNRRVEGNFPSVTLVRASDIEPTAKANREPLPLGAKLPPGF